MNKLFSVTLFLFFGFSFAQIDTGDFSNLEVFDRLDAILIPSNKNQIEILGDKADQVNYINKNGKLKLRMKLDEFLQGDKTTVKVYYKNIHSIRASEGAAVSSAKTLKTSQLSLNAKEGAVIDLNVETTSLDIKTTSGGVISLNGKTVNQDIVCNAGGSYEGRKLTSKTTNITVNAGGSAEVYASDFVNAKTRAGGNIDIYGGGKVEKKTTLGGNIIVH